MSIFSAWTKGVQAYLETFPPLAYAFALMCLREERENARNSLDAFGEHADVGYRLCASAGFS